MDSTLILACGVALGVLTIFLGLGLLIGKRQVPLENRIDEYAQVATAARTQEKEKIPEGRRVKRLAPANLDKYLKDELARADLAFTVTEYIFLNIITTVLGLILGYAIFRENFLLAFLGMIAGFYAPTAYVRYSQGNRCAAFSNQIENTLVLLANSLRSGYGLMQAIESVSKQVPPPASEEFGRVVREFALGVSMDRALDNLLIRNPSVDLELLITAINVSRLSGGNLAEIIDTITSTIRERVRLTGEIHALTAQQRFSAAILTFLPGVLGLILFAVNPDYFSPLWQNSCGLAILGTGLVLIIIGNLVIRRIIAIEY